MLFTQWLLVLTLGVLNASYFVYTIKLNGAAQSFSSVIKQYNYKTLGEEVTLYKKKFSDIGYVTEQWFTSSADGPFNENGRIRVYIDGETVASLDFMLTMAQAIDAAAEKQQNNPPWSSRMFGRLASGSGYFNTFRIPFMSSIKITVTNEVNTGNLWYIVRGLVGVQFTVGQFDLQPSSRLRVYKTNTTIAPLQFVTLSNTANKSGMLFLVTFNIKSESATFMEGCVRAIIDGSNETTFLSSGTEDFFLSAFYFNGGEYHGFHSGLTYKSETGPSTQIVAYKFFVDDPILFTKSFKLIWRNFEEEGGPNGCPNQFPANVDEEGFPVHFSKELQERFGSPADAHVQSYVWVYEWDTY